MRLRLLRVIRFGVIVPSATGFLDETTGVGREGIEFHFREEFFAIPGRAGFDNGDHPCAVERLELYDHLGKPVCESSTEARQEGALPDIIVD